MQAANRDLGVEAHTEAPQVQDVEQVGQQIAVGYPDDHGEPDDQQRNFLERASSRHRVDHPGADDRHEQFPGHDRRADQDQDSSRRLELPGEEPGHSYKLHEAMQVTPSSIAHLAQALAGADGHSRTGREELSWKCHGITSVLLPPHSVTWYTDREIKVAQRDKI